MIGVLAPVSVVIAALGGAVVDQRRVASAADLSALAAASALQSGADACAAASAVARRNGARLDGCRRSGEVVRVKLVRAASPVLGMAVQVSAQARAGPVGAE
jgi:secretion/DNA translocation related TadE-like protein